MSKPDRFSNPVIPSSCVILICSSDRLIREAPIEPIRIAGTAETDNMICQSSPAVRVVHATLMRQAITRDVRKADTEMAATISVVIVGVALARLHQLAGVGEAKALESQGGESKGRHYGR